MKIREFLKNKKITIVDFAKNIKLSRNTAMLYIDKYDKNEPIPKEKYQKIFDKLFKNYDDFEINYFKLSNEEKIFTSTTQEALNKLSLAISKLNKYENIDKEIGVSYLELNEIIKNGIVKNDGIKETVITQVYIAYIDNEYIIADMITDEAFLLKDLGNTWYFNRNPNKLEVFDNE